MLSCALRLLLPAPADGRKVCYARWLALQVEHLRALVEPHQDEVTEGESEGEGEGEGRGRV